MDSSVTPQIIPMRMEVIGPREIPEHLQPHCQSIHWPCLEDGMHQLCHIRFLLRLYTAVLGSSLTGQKRAPPAVRIPALDLNAKHE